MRNNNKHVRIYCGQKIAESARQNTVAQFPFVDSTGTVAESMTAKSFLEKENVKMKKSFENVRFPPRVARKDVVRGYPFVDMKGTAKTTIRSEPSSSGKKERLTIPIPLVASKVEEKEKEEEKTTTTTTTDNMRDLIISSGSCDDDDDDDDNDINTYSSNGTEFALRLLPSSRVKALRTIFQTVKGRGLSSLHLLDTLQSMGLAVTPVMLQECLYAVGVRCPIQHFNDFAAIYTSISIRTNHGSGGGRVSAHEAMLRDFVGDVAYRAVRATFKRAVKKNRIASDENERVSGRPGPRVGATKQQLKASRISIETACDLLRTSLPSYVPVIRKNMRKFFYKRRRSSPSDGVDFVDVLRAYSHLQRHAHRWRDVAPQRAPIDSYEASRQARTSTSSSSRRQTKKAPILQIADAILDRFSGNISSSSSSSKKLEDDDDDEVESSSAESLNNKIDVQIKNRDSRAKVTSKATPSVKPRRSIAWSFDPSGPRDVVIRDTPKQPASSKRDGLFATFEAYVFVRVCMSF